MSKTADNQTKKTKKRPVVHRSKSPSQIPLLLAYIVFALVMVALSYFRLTSDQAVMLITGGVTILFSIFLAVYQVYFKLKHRIVRIILGLTIPFWLIAGGFILYSGVVYPDAVFQGDLTRAEREKTFNISGGTYLLSATGHFPEMPKEDGKKTPRPNYRGNFVLTLSDSSGNVQSKTFTGMLESIVQRQRVTKKGSGWVTRDIHTRLFNFSVKNNGQYRLTLTNLDEKLADPLTISIYPTNYYHIPLIVLAFIGIGALAFIDFLMRNAREFSFFSSAMASAFGFLAYFHFLSEPGTNPSTMAMTIVVGTLIGVAIAVVLDYALKKPFTELNRKWRINL